MVRLIALRSCMRSGQSTTTLTLLVVNTASATQWLQGEGLESAIACPAWAPVLSLESIDGQLWREMRNDFDVLMRQLPPAARLQVGGS